MARRTAMLMAVSALLAALTPTAALAKAPSRGRAFVPTPVSKPLYAIAPPQANPERQTHYVEGADGVDIYVETWLPAPKGGHKPPKRVPTVLVITPYTGLGAVEEPMTLDAVVPRGYAYSQMHVRGTGRSGGCMEQFSSNEVNDAANVIEYLGTDAPWSNGVVGGSGLSYPGISLVAVAGRGHPVKTKYLRAIIAGGVASSQYDYNFFDGVPYTGAALVHSTSYNAVISPLPGNDPNSPNYVEKPLCVLDVLMGSADFSGDMTPFWLDRDHRQGVGNIRAASFIYHGHYDTIDTPIALAGLFEQLPRTTPKHALIGAFAHAYPYSHGTPAWERADFVDMQVAWFDQYLKGLDSGVDRWPTVQVQGMDGQWRAEPEWPMTGGPVGQLALSTDNALGATKPDGSSAYTEGVSFDGPTASIPGGRVVFETAPLKADLHITGLPVADLWVQLSEPDAHIAVKLEVLNPSGNPLARGTIKGYRSASHLEPLIDNRFAQSSGQPPPVGKPIRIPVRFNPTDIIVPRGGSLRLTVGGSQFHAGSFPSQPSGMGTTVEILHDCKHPSVLRFLMPRPHPDFLNVREKDESGKLPSTLSGRISVDGGGVATRRVCGRAPQRIDLLRQ